MYIYIYTHNIATPKPTSQTSGKHIMLQTFLSFGGVSLHVCSLYMWLCLKIGGLATIDGYKRIGAMMMNQGEPETNSFCVEAL